MDAASPQFWPVFLELFQGLPRQGPGNHACAEKALALCIELPGYPRILDVGCGTGGQTLHLAALTKGSIVALDPMESSIARLRNAIAARGLENRIEALAIGLTEAALPPRSFDLIWSEGALYNLGLESALGLCRKLLRDGGYLCFTEPIWRTDTPPPEVKQSFDFDYPAMGRNTDVLETIEHTEFSVVDHFTLPDNAWWDDFYTPMEARITELRHKYEHDLEALEVLDQLAQEPAMHREHSACYAYEFFVLRAPD